MKILFYQQPATQAKQISGDQLGLLLNKDYDSQSMVKALNIYPRNKNYEKWSNGTDGLYQLGCQAYFVSTLKHSQQIPNEIPRHNCSTCFPIMSKSS